MTAAWTREVLAELRASRFGLRAWIRFRRRSFARAREQRRAHPLAHQQVLVLASVGPVAYAGAAVAGRAELAAAGVAWWLLVVLMADWHLGMLDGLKGLGSANVISLLRAGTPPSLLGLGISPIAVAIFAAAGVADVLDGAVARRRGEETRFGFWLDGAADGFVIGAAALAALPMWAAAVVVARFALPWLTIAVATFARAQLTASTAFVRRRAPGLVLFAGLALALLGLPGGAAAAVAGAAVALGVFALSVRRSARLALA
jgi:CDP-diacylglycerol--glycerol-3-phosphate 3-phosphatidyltransferase